ncbi:ABC transporter ATP-binding protein [Arthrobacter mobilis]|uniref:ABC transporter ATP-binding protein n=1 Tax=Arthrobacter mobilis TaxID=2724944 RepID=A0A7X6HD02_9MICC|nr:ABC transporter ATP-binding protein [Arthrobacter mobilis]NKX54868.1 ABC transporter ATP-binding protein [Arthrobacter mobilis]
MEVEVGSYRYPDSTRPVLSGLRLSVAPGTLTVVAGASGSGKSTLGGIMAGYLPAGTGGRLAGRIRLAGQTVEYDGGGEPPVVNLRQWARHVAYVPQDARTYLSMIRSTVEEELAFGLENFAVPPESMSARIAAVAARLDLEPLLQRDPARLSGGQERLVAIAAAAVSGAGVLVLDEPLAGLDEGAAARVAATVGVLRAAGTAVVVLTQALDALASGASHALLLQDGTPVACGPDPVRRQAAGVGVVVPGTAVGAALPAPPSGAEVLLEYRGVGFGYPAPGRPGRRKRIPSAGPRLLDGLDLAVHAGECVALTGANGTGKTTLLKMALGLVRPDAGTVRVAGFDAGTAAVAALASVAGFLFQNPADQLFERTVRREVAFGSPRSRPGPEAVHAALEACGLTGSAEAHPYELPAARRRLVALATVLARAPKVLVLDEPTVALDGHGRQLLGKVLARAAEQGAAVLLSTHDPDFARSHCHRTVALEGAMQRSA